MTSKICKKCNLKIQKKEKGVTWITFKGDEELEVIHWHFKCFEEWKNESLENKANKIYLETLKNITPKFKDMLNNLNSFNEDKQFEIVNKN